MANNNLTSWIPGGETVQKVVGYTAAAGAVAAVTYGVGRYFGIFGAEETVVTTKKKRKKKPAAPRAAKH